MLNTIIIKAVSKDKNQEESYWYYLEIYQEPPTFSTEICKDFTIIDTIRKTMRDITKNKDPV